MPLNRGFCPDLGAQAGSKFLEKTVFKKISQKIFLGFLGFAVPTRTHVSKLVGGSVILNRSVWYIRLLLLQSSRIRYFKVAIMLSQH